jgi:hypothetical protein
MDRRRAEAREMAHFYDGRLAKKRAEASRHAAIEAARGRERTRRQICKLNWRERSLWQEAHSVTIGTAP